MSSVDYRYERCDAEGNWAKVGLDEIRKFCFIRIFDYDGNLLKKGRVVDVEREFDREGGTASINLTFDTPPEKEEKPAWSIFNFTGPGKV